MDNQELPNKSDGLAAGLAQVLRRVVRRAIENPLSLFTAPGNWEVATWNDPFQPPHPSKGEITLPYSQRGICAVLRHSYEGFPDLVRFE